MERYLKIKANIRYIEDSTINGVPDEDGNMMGLNGNL
jgi:hypothetical protein